MMMKIKEGYQLGSHPTYIEVRYVSKWYLSVKLHTLVVRLFSVRPSDKVLGRRKTEYVEDEGISV